MAKKKATEPDNGAATAEAPRPRQNYLSAEMAPPSIPEIDSVASEFYQAGRAAKLAREREQELGDALIGLMVRHKLWAYRFEEHVVTMERKNKVKVAKDSGE